MDAELTTVATPQDESEPTTAERPPAAVTAETTAVRRVQNVLAREPVVTVAKGMSKFGDHALGWLALGAVGAITDRRRRREWLLAAVGVAASHGASIAVKRLVRRERPGDPGIRVLVSTPSRLSFPSSHATSTTTAAVLYGRLLGRGLTPVLVPPMMVSRLVLGVHYPSDVVVGSSLGGAVALSVRRYVKRRRNCG
ncbi:5'-phosphoribosyl-monophospho-decaprenol phosphatase [Actinopolyspora xinjiangensis]|uniref:5'-phosphoribosyl-monophospho-decaprenol phosphatase n=1 Tax=Actinopolyspora xinjiangensis TaxID=405564 RepID=A0A1H0WR22_9ACTN|nr:phosphatase PAP2 family protein [Actinopolyspora xinjiangensis]SDP93137.1 5'-phosphoribosyl-monophospho-decaprenol phosphatase [Actinopolyspora xinjiangensis]